MLSYYRTTRTSYEDDGRSLLDDALVYPAPEMREAKAISKLDHPHIGTLFGVGEQDFAEAPETDVG